MPENAVTDPGGADPILENFDWLSEAEILALRLALRYPNIDP